MADSPQSCPCCGRSFERITDYPRVRVLSFEQLPVPEAIDDMSDAAAEKSMGWHRGHPEDTVWSRRAINMTPDIERACRTVQVQDYLHRLAELVGRETEPSELQPSFPADRVFKGAYPVADTPIFLSLTEGDAAAEGTRTAEVETLCRGPSMGSAGGPTLMQLGPIARLTYQGLLTPADQAS